MEENKNTDLNFIKEIIEKAQDEKSLFNSALKKLVNSTEGELDDFLKTKKKNLRLLSDGQSLSLKELDGKRLIYNSTKTFPSFIDENFKNWGLDKEGVATPKTPIQVHEIVQDSTFMDIFVSLPGTWNQKWLSQNQVIEFCKGLSSWLSLTGATLFLVKKDENQPVDEKNPQENLAMVRVRVRGSGLRVYINPFEFGFSCGAKYFYRIVSPQLMPLTQ